MQKYKLQILEPICCTKMNPFFGIDISWFPIDIPPSGLIYMLHITFIAFALQSGYVPYTMINQCYMGFFYDHLFYAYGLCFMIGQLPSFHFFSFCSSIHFFLLCLFTLVSFVTLMFPLSCHPWSCSLTTNDISYAHFTFSFHSDFSLHYMFGQNWELESKLECLTVQIRCFSLTD